MNDLIKSNGNLPAHAQATGKSNLASDMGGSGAPRLGFKGSRFRINMGGDERVLGGTELKVVILEANPHVSRVFYGTAYDPESSSRPECASADGVTPLASIAEPQSKACNVCPMNEKGSAVTDTGGKTRACSFYKRTVLLLVDQPELGPLVADMKAMSMFGKSYPDKGLFSLRDYAQRLDQNKVMPYAVVTTLEFDVNESVPKVLFRATDYTSAEFHEEHVMPLLESGELETLVSTDDVTTAGAEEEAPANDGFRDKLLSKPDPKDEEEEDEPEAEAEQEEEEAPKPKAKATKKKATKKKATKKKAAKKPEPEDEDADDDDADDADDAAEFDDDLENALAEFDFD